ncbi:MAG: nucleoside deaminase, partial [Campylobacterota bacterium]|nr:nucleoside deaminase [Campylobacterota bacterium]
LLKKQVETEFVFNMNRWMKLAYNEATTGMLSNAGGPFGAVIIKDDTIIASAHNEVLKTKDATAHAEINAIRKACQKLDSFNLSGCILYTTCEPCPMCLGAIFWSRIDTVYYGATKDDAAYGGFDDSRFYDLLNNKNNSLSMKQIDHKENAKLFERWLDKENHQIY